MDPIKKRAIQSTGHRPMRLTVTLSGLVFQRIERHSFDQGRSMSNLVAYLIEQSLDRMDAARGMTTNTTPPPTHDYAPR